MNPGPQSLFTSPHNRSVVCLCQSNKIPWSISSDIKDLEEDLLPLYCFLAKMRNLNRERFLLASLSMIHQNFFSSLSKVLLRVVESSQHLNLNASSYFFLEFLDWLLATLMKIEKRLYILTAFSLLQNKFCQILVKFVSKNKSSALTMGDHYLFAVRILLALCELFP